MPLLPASDAWEAYFHAQLDIISESASFKNCFFLMLEITGWLFLELLNMILEIEASLSIINSLNTFLGW